MGRILLACLFCMIIPIAGTLAGFLATQTLHDVAAVLFTMGGIGAFAIIVLTSFNEER